MSIAHFLLSGLSIVLIDLVLAGDNALVIALAVRALPKDQRRVGIICGAGLAVLLRVLLTAVAAKLLTLPFLKLAGGLLVLWIAFKVLVDVSDSEEKTPAPRRFLQAIWQITAADITMSTDNILAIAGASNGHFGLIVFGLGLSIPFVVFSSHLLSKLMDRFPILIYMGVAILGAVAGNMIAGDPFVTQRVPVSTVVRYAVDGILIVAVLAVGIWVGRRRKNRNQRSGSGGQG
jgi:YjbE family integral membrane protein